QRQLDDLGQKGARPDLWQRGPGLDDDDEAQHQRDRPNDRKRVDSGEQDLAGDDPEDLAPAAPRGREELSEGTQTKNEDRRRELEALEHLPAGPSNHTGLGEGLPSRDVLFLPVCQEFLQADVGQWMLDELLEGGKRHGADVPADLGGLHHVLRMAYAGHQHLRLEVVVPVDGHDVPDEPHAVLADVVQPPNEGTDAPGAGLGGQEGLARRETQRDIDLDPFRRQCLAGFQALRDQRDLDHDVLMDLGEVFALFDHRVGFDADDLGADRAVHDRADFLEEVLETTPFLGHYRWIGGHAVQDAPAGRFLDFFRVAGVQKDHHREPPGEGVRVCAGLVCYSRRIPRALQTGTV